MSKVNKKEIHNLFKGIHEGEESKFNELYEKYNKLVYHISFSILKNKENSEDVMQSVFTKIYQLDKEKLPNTNETSWLYSVTKNETLNYLRKQKNESDLENVYYVSEDKEIENIMNKDSYNRIIESLDNKEKEIVSLRTVSELSFREISELLDIPIGTVQWKYYKSLHTLKMLLSNISMAIIGLTLFVTKNFRSMDKKENQIVEDSIIDSSDDTNKETNGDSIEDILGKIENSTTNSTIDNAVSDTKFDVVDIGLIGFSGIFLCIAIICAAILKKRKRI